MNIQPAALQHGNASDSGEAAIHVPSNSQMNNKMALLAAAAMLNAVTTLQNPATKWDITGTKASTVREGQRRA